MFHRSHIFAEGYGDFNPVALAAGIVVAGIVVPCSEQEILMALTVSNPRYALSAVPELLERGAHFVLAARWGDLKDDRTQSKKPVWEAWLQRRPDCSAVKGHMDRDGLLGIVPASLGMAVLDVDSGDATDLIVPPLVSLPIAAPWPGPPLVQGLRVRRRRWLNPR